MHVPSIKGTREAFVHTSSNQGGYMYIMSSTIDLAHTKAEPIPFETLHRFDEVVHHNLTVSSS